MRRNKLNNKPRKDWIDLSIPHSGKEIVQEFYKFICNDELVSEFPEDLYLVEDINSGYLKPNELYTLERVTITQRRGTISLQQLKIINFTENKSRDILEIITSNGESICTFMNRYIDGLIFKKE